MKRIFLATAILIHVYGWGMDPFGGGVTYDATDPWRAPWMPQYDPPMIRPWDSHDWLYWRHRGY